MVVIMISSDPAVKKDTATARRIEEYRRLVDELYTIVIAGRFNVFGFLRAYWEGARIIRDRKRENMLVTVQDPPERWVVGWLLSRRFGVPLEVQVHTDMRSPYLLRESLKNRIRFVVARFLLPRATCVRVVSKRIRASLVMLFPLLEKKITVLPIYVDTETLSGLHHIEDNVRFRFLVVSRLSREKNIGLAVRAFRAIHKEFPDTQLIIVGDGPERKNLELQISNFKLNNAVVFTGWEEHITRRYQFADCYLLSSNYEGYGRTVVEALAAGVPVIMTDVGVAGELVENEKTGLVVPVGDEAAFLSAMRRVVQDRYVRRILSENGREAIKQLPSHDEYLQAYKTMWHTCGRKK